MVQGSGFRQGSGRLRVEGVGCRVEGSGLRGHFGDVEFARRTLRLGHHDFDHLQLVVDRRQLPIRPGRALHGERYRGTSAIRNSAPLGPYSRKMGGRPLPVRPGQASGVTKPIDIPRRLNFTRAKKRSRNRISAPRTDNERPLPSARYPCVRGHRSNRDPVSSQRHNLCEGTHQKSHIRSPD